MGQGVLVSVAPIITPADDLSLMDNNTADWHFPQGKGLLRLF